MFVGLKTSNDEKDYFVFDTKLGINFQYCC